MTSSAALTEIRKRHYALEALPDTIVIPVLGEIRRDTCLDWQAKPFAITSAHRTRMHRACRDGCPHSHLGDGE